VHHGVGDWLARVAGRISPVPLDPIELPLEKCRISTRCISVDVDAEHDRRFMRLEKWLRAHVIRKIPGGSAQKESK
jgi:hypothetical protein